MLGVPFGPSSMLGVSPSLKCVRDARRLSHLVALLGLLGLLALCALLVVAMDAVIAHPLSDPLRASASLAGGVALACLVRFVWTAGKHAAAARTWAEAQQVTGRVVLAGHPVDIIRHDGVVACTVGLVRCRILASDTALERLGPDELRAVAAHEAEHARRRDPLRLVLAASAQAALSFVPGAARARRRFGALLEMAADERAERSAGRRALAGALLALSERAGSHGLPMERVDRMLVGRPARLGLSAGGLLLDALVLSAVLLATVLVVVQTGCLTLLDGLEACASAGPGSPLVGLTGVAVVTLGCTALLTAGAVRPRRERLA